MTNIKRTYLSILLAVTLILGNISTSFAAVPMLHELYSFDFISLIDNDTHLGVFESSKLPEGDERREYLIEWMEVMDGTREAGEYLYLLSVHSSSSSSIRFNFSRIPLNSYYYLTFVGGKSNLKFFPSKSTPVTTSSDSQLSISYLFYTYNISNPNNTNFSLLSNSKIVQSSHIIAGSDPDYFVNRKHSQGINFNLEQHGCDWVGKLIFNFDDDLYGSPEPEPKPEPEPLPPYVPPELPDIPAGDGKYVVYDTSVWKGFLNHVVGNIGSAVKAGLLILGIISGILLVIKVVKMFTRSA